MEKVSFFSSITHDFMVDFFFTRVTGCIDMLYNPFWVVAQHVNGARCAIGPTSLSRNSAKISEDTDFGAGGL